VWAVLHLKGSKEEADRMTNFQIMFADSPFNAKC
jgi:hypothetical protein